MTILCSKVFLFGLVVGVVCNKNVNVWLI